MQRGSLAMVSRKEGPAVWQFRWSEKGLSGARVQRKKVIGTIERYPNEASARSVISVLLAETNSEKARIGTTSITIAQLCDHFEQRELTKDNPWRSHATKKTYQVLASAVLLRVHRFASFQCRKLFDGFPYSLLSETQIINTLEIEPELCACSKEVSEAQSGIARDGAGSIQDLCDAIGWHVDLSRQLGGAHVERFQFFRQVFPRMDSRQCHIDAPSDSPQSPH